MNENPSRFFLRKQDVGGVGQNRRGTVVGDPSNTDKMQAVYDEVAEMSQVSYRWRARASVSVPEYVIPYRPMVLRIGGRYPTTGPSRITNVQRAVLDFMSRLVLSSEDRAEIRAQIMANRRADVRGLG